MTPSASTNFTCNVCGKVCERSAATFGREIPSCPHCQSSVRVRGMAALLSREIFGVELALPDFPIAKSLRGIGMTDPPTLAAGLAEKFDYTNTFYHQSPHLDITQPAEADLGRYDFIVSSEVMEHVPPPVELAFVNLYRMLKPNGLLLLTVPYGLDERTAEHFPELHEYGLASVGGRLVLVNRRRDGSTEVFENLCFHGGDGSTVEMRVFSEESLGEAIRGAGFADVRIACEDVPEFGVHHQETWSLPIVARKGNFNLPPAELALAYRDAALKLGALTSTHLEMERTLHERLQWVLSLKDELERTRAELVRQAELHGSSRQDMERMLAESQEMERTLAESQERAVRLKDELERTRAELTNFAEFHSSSHEKMKRELDERLEWVRRIEGEFEERTQWALSLRKELDEVLATRAHLESRLWTRIGRRLGVLS